MMLETGGVAPRQIPIDEMFDLFQQTRDFWRRWLDRSTYTGRWREMVTRSAMTLADDRADRRARRGADPPSPSRSGERNWDYRTGPRVVLGLRCRPATEEAEAFVGC
jgi:hypothetical protein